MNSDIKEIAKILSEAGIRPSAQRIAILRYLTTHFTHPTVDDIYKELIQDYPTISRTTIYNTLRLLVGSGKILALGIDPANQRYDAAIHDHGHFMCNNCGSIIDIEIEQWPQIPIDTKVSQTQLLYHGICRECYTKQ